MFRSIVPSLRRAFSSQPAPRNVLVYGGGGSLYGVEEHYPPMPPALTARDVIKPPSPPPEGSMLQQRLMSALALGLGGLMLAGFVMCFYCFFSQVTSPLTGTRSAA
jgi:hypothetical protein